jgi:hypothetical protein
MVRSHDDSIALYYALVDGGAPSGTTTDEPHTTTTPSEETHTTPLSYASDIQPIWDASCQGTVCHDPAGTLGNGLDLSGNAYDRLVGVGAVGANRPLVDPSEPDNSYLLNKLDGSFADPDVNGGGGQMPLLMPALDDGTIDTVRSWIAQGAPP